MGLIEGTYSEPLQYKFMQGKKEIVIDMPPWKELVFDDELEKKIGSIMDTKYRIFYNPLDKMFFCFNFNRDDRHSELKLRFPYWIPVSRVKRIWDIITDNFPVLHNPENKKARHDHSFNRHSLAPLIIKEFGFDCGTYQFFTEKTKFNEPFYSYPLQILQLRGCVRFGRASWRVK